MAWYYILLIVFACLIVFAFTIFTLDAYMVNRIIFDKRRDARSYIPQYSGEKFHLHTQPISFACYGKKLNGFIYTDRDIKDCTKLILFAHGLGPGHLPYMNEIAFLCHCGYVVLSYDNIGCNLSEGKGTRGFYSGCECLKKAYYYACSRQDLNWLPIYIVGHSWGGYSTLCAVSQIKVKAVVTFSAPLTPVKIIEEGAYPRIKHKPHVKARLRYLAFLAPWIWFIVICRCGVRGNMNSARSLERSKTPALLIHGGADTTIQPANSAACNAKGKLISSHIEEGKFHNPYITKQAQECHKSLVKALRTLPDDEERAQFCATFDFDSAYEEEASVMQLMKDFLESH